MDEEWLTEQMEQNARELEQHDLERGARSPEAKSFPRQPFNMEILNADGSVRWKEAAIACPTQLLHPDAVPPRRAGELDAGYDICCVGGLQGLQDAGQWRAEQLLQWKKMGEQGWADLQPGAGFLFRTGFAQAIHPDYACLLWDRSGLGAIKQVHRLAGVIDASFRGEWMVRLVNLGPSVVRINCGDRIVQGIYQRRVTVECPIVTTLSETSRGAAGFGSTGK